MWPAAVEAGPRCSAVQQCRKCGVWSVDCEERLLDAVGGVGMAMKWREGCGFCVGGDGAEGLVVCWCGLGDVDAVWCGGLEGGFG